MGNQVEALVRKTSGERKGDMEDFRVKLFYTCNNPRCPHLSATGEKQWTLTNRQNPECPFCEEPYEMGKFKTVCAIIVNDKNGILLTKRAREPFREYWALPSGIGESILGKPPEVGVIEEVRCDLGTNSFEGERLFSMPVEEDKMTDEIVVFVGRINESELEPDPEYSLGYKWVSFDKVEEFENLAFEHGEIIKKYLRQKGS
jgi:ADP-ribose pyrophosphatase YjhB (NUDIX family)